MISKVLELYKRWFLNPLKSPEILVKKPTTFKVGAWTGRSAIYAPAKYLDLAESLGLGRLDLFINDFSLQRRDTNCTTYDVRKIESFIQKADLLGIDVHLSSWIMPHTKFIETSKDTVLALAKNNPVKSIMWDAEEPWTQAVPRESSTYTDAAQRIADIYKPEGIKMGVTGIGYTSRVKFGPLAAVCDYLVPQCYATSTSGLSPKNVVPHLVDRYRTFFGAKEVVVGLAAYRQPPLKYTVDEAMAMCLESALKIDNCTDVVYWSLSSIRRNSKVRSTIQELINVHT